MEDKNKSREQLIQELEDTRRRHARLESEESNRKVVEAVLRESEERFRTIFDSSLDIMLIADTENRRFLGGNTVAQKVLGYTSQEFRNLRVMDIHPKADVPRMVDLFDKMARREASVGENVPVQCKDGRVFYADIMSSLITLAGKQYLLGIFRDLTELKRMEDKVKKTEEIYHSIVTHSPNYIYVNNMNGYFVDASPALLAKLGLSLEEIQKTTFMEWFAGENRDEILQAVGRLRNGQAVQSLNSRAKTARGEIFEFELNAVPLFEHGRLTMVLSMARDITEEKRAQDALEKSEERYRSLVTNIPDVIWTNDSIGNTTYISPNIEAIYGYTQEEIYRGGKPIWLERIHPEDRERVWQSFQALFAQKSPYDLEYRIQRKDGKWIWLHTRSTSVYEKDGVTYADGIFSDITRRKQAEQALQESEEKYRHLVETSDDMIFTVDRMGNFTFMNPALEKHLGYSREELLKMNGFESIHPDDRETVRQAFSRMVENRGTVTYEYRYRTKSGWYINILTSGSVIVGKDGKPAGAFGIARNITERKNWEDRLQRAYDELENIITQRTLDLTKANQGLRLEIAERQRAEQALRESEEMYRVLTETSSDTIVTINLEGNLVFASQRTLKMFGYQNANEVIGRSGFDWVAPEDRDKAVASFQSALGHGFARNIELKLIRKDKSSFIGELNAAMIKDRQGQPRNFVAMVRDVTERRQIQDLLYAQRNLGVALSATNKLDEALRLCLESAIQASGMDSGGIYLVDEKTGALDLAFSRELFPDFVEAVSHYDASSPNAMLIREGKPIFGRPRNFGISDNEIDQREGLRALAVIPIWFENRVIACLNISSHVSDEIPMIARHALVGISVQIGNAIARIRMENALRESEEMYKALTETSSDGVYVTDLNGKFVDLSRRALDIFGYSNIEEMRGMNGFDVVYPDDRELAAQGLQKSLVTGYTRNHEFRLVRKDKSIFWGDLSSILLRDKNGNPKYFVCMGRDITERKRAEEAIRESEEMYKTLAETTSDAVAVTDLFGTILKISPRSVEKLRARSPEEIIGKNGLNFIIPEEREEGLKNIIRVIQKGSALNKEYTFVRMDQSRMFGEMNTVLLKDSTGNPKYLISTIRDITERKQAEEAIRKSEEMYRTLVHTSPDAIIVTDLQGRIIEASQKNLEFTGYRDAKDLIGLSSFNGVAPEEHGRAIKIWQKILKDGFAQNMEYNMIKKDGTRFFGELNATLVKDTHGNPLSILAIIRDITERKRLEKELLEISAREQRRIGQDLHDGLSQHLTAISFMNKSLENKLAAKSPAEAKEAAKISQLVSQAISQTRSLARGLYPVELRAEGLMSSLKQLSINQENLFGISCLFQCNKRILIDDNIVSTNLYYIAQEAVSNAIKHGKAKRIKIRLSEVKNKITMTVSDNGAGIPKNLKVNGGLGLQIMDYRAKMIGASLGVQAGRKGGTLVTCSLHAPQKSLH